MVLGEHLVQMDEQRQFRVYPIGDMHATLRTFDEARFQRYVKTIAEDPAGVAIVMGDVSDARSKDHKFFTPDMVNPRFQIEDLDVLEDKVAEYAVDLLKPLGDKLLGVLRGNHHQAGFTHTLRRMYRYATDHNPLDLGDRTMLRLRVQIPGEERPRFVYNVFAQHVTSGGRKPGSQVNQQIDNIASFDADLYLFAHSHKPIAHAHRRVGLPRSGALRLVRKNVVLITANAWVADVAEGANSYADEKGLPTTADLVHYAEVAYRRSHTEHDLAAKYVVWD
jgi:hypothetical protein